MEPCMSSRYWLSWFCIPASDAIPDWRKRWGVEFTAFVFLFNTIATMTSLAYTVAYLNVDIQLALYSIYPVIAFVSTTYGVAVLIIFRREIVVMMENLDTIYRENENDDAFEYISRANVDCEDFWRKIYRNACVITFHGSTVVMGSISLVLCYYTKGHFDTNLVYHPHHEILPWNQSTLYGYACEISLYTVDSVTYFFGYCLLLIMFISLCKHHMAFFEFFQHKVKQLDTIDKHQHRKLLCKIVYFHVSAKKWFLESAEIYSLIVLIQLIASMLLMSCAVFQVDMQIRNTTFDVVFVIIQIAIAIANLFCYCYYGKMASQSYEDMAICLFESDWQKLSVRLQTFLIPMIQNAQRPIYYHGFGVAVLNLETFMRLLRAVVTYYLAFKSMMK